MSSLLVLKEGFATFRNQCRYRSYYYHNHSYTRCDHPKSKTNSCSEEATPGDCPRVEECIPH